MAMKKKFLALAMAAAVAFPVGSVYANTTTGDPITVEKDDKAPFNHEVIVTGEVKTAQGTAAAGKITVELPTTMAFTVNENAEFTGATYTVDNKSACGIDVSVAQFTTTKNGITLKERTEIESDRTTSNLLDRSNVSLQLKGKTDESPVKIIDLAKVAKGTEDNAKILDVVAGGQETIALEGLSGKKEVKGSDDQPDGVDKNGARGEFTLVFKIQKDSQI